MYSSTPIMDYEDELIIELSNDTWEPKVNLHNRILIEIPKNRRSYWVNRLNEFYSLYFKNKKSKRDSISKAADEVIDEIYVSDEKTMEEPQKPLKHKSKSKKKDQDDILKLMKGSISIENKESEIIKINPMKNINLKNFNESKGVIVSISNELEFHQKQTLKCALKAGECLIKIQQLCAIENKKFI